MKGICRFLRGAFSTSRSNSAPCAARHGDRAPWLQRDFSCDPQTSKSQTVAAPLCRGASCDFSFQNHAHSIRKGFAASLRGFFDESQQFKLHAPRGTATERRGYSAISRVAHKLQKSQTVAAPLCRGASCDFVSKHAHSIRRDLPLSPRGFFDESRAIQAPCAARHGDRAPWLQRDFSCDPQTKKSQSCSRPPLCRGASMLTSFSKPRSLNSEKGICRFLRGAFSTRSRQQFQAPCAPRGTATEPPWLQRKFSCEPQNFKKGQP